jgi:hypothetical protein
MTRKSSFYFLLSALFPLAITLYIALSNDVAGNRGIIIYQVLIVLPVALYAIATLIAGSPHYERWFVTTAVIHTSVWMLCHALSPVLPLGQLYVVTVLPLLTLAGILVIPWCCYVRIAGRKAR